MLRRAWTAIDERATPRVVLVVGWLVFLVYAYPGFMSPDSIIQLAEARVSVYGDWHPPFMAFLWRQCEHVATGPFPMLVLQSVAMLLGLASVLRHVMTARRAAIAAVAILLFPPVLTTMAVIWKDSQMAGYLLAGVAALLSTRRRWRLFGCALLVAATAMRHNAPAATLPLVVLLFVWRDGLAWWKRYGIAVVAWIAITLAAMTTNHVLTTREDFAWHNSLAILDLVGTIRYAAPMSDDELRDELSGTPLVITHDIWKWARRIYVPTAHYWLTHGDDRMFDLPNNEAQRDALARSWLEVVEAHPRAYFRHRRKVFREVLGASENPPAGPVWTELIAPESVGTLVGYDATHSAAQSAWLAAMTAIGESWLFRAWMYFVLAFALLAFCRRERLVGALLLSGIAYELSLAIAAPSSDFRYSHWMIACTTIATVMLISRRRAATATHARAPTAPVPDSETKSARAPVT